MWRRIQLWSLGVLLAAILTAAAILTFHILASRSTNLADRLAEAGDLLSGGILLLAVLAALVALLAYAVATGMPKLELQVCFEFSKPNRPVFKASTSEDGWLKADSFKQTRGAISLKNRSVYTARNPAVVIRLNGLAFHSAEFSQSREWVTVAFANTIGITAIQWDGGPSFYIHGRSIRHLPTVNFQGLTQVPNWGDPGLSIELLADGGYRRVVKIPIGFQVGGELTSESAKLDALPPWI
jgi:hypothetical protein